jgi:hypothetical protein
MEKFCEPLQGAASASTTPTNLWPRSVQRLAGSDFVVMKTPLEIGATTLGEGLTKKAAQTAAPLAWFEEDAYSPIAALFRGLR